MPDIVPSENATSRQQLRRLHAKIYGTVQRVGFRLYVREAARQLDLAGWVRNRRGGLVEVMAEGSRPALSELLAKLEEGPKGAGVTHVEREWLPPTSSLTGFRVRWLGFL